MSNLIVDDNSIISKQDNMAIGHSEMKYKCTPAKKALGFTLIEAIIVVAIVGILATVAYPSYIDQITRSNRAEALRELTRIANLQEQFFVDNRLYTANLSQLGLGSATSFKTESESYIITSVINPAGNIFTLTATAQGSQATNDSLCLTMGITDTGNKLSSATPQTLCWEQ